MIRKFETQDLDAVMQIWLQANLDAHAFIPASFWEAHFEMVRDMLPQAELYVHENEDPRQIDGFIGLTENHIEGIFVAKAARSNGIGKALLDHVKPLKPRLTLGVYPKNERALAFYRREQFAVHYLGRHRRGYERSGDSDALDTAGVKNDGGRSAALRFVNL